jgi:segregation and condensation protein B
MDQTEIKYFVEAALFAAGRPLSVDQLQGLFDGRSAPEKSQLRDAIVELQSEYEPRGIEIVEVASGFRIQVRAGMVERLQRLWEERAPRYSRALFETLALVAYRQPITRGEIEEVRGVSVSPNIIRTLLEREWVRVVGHRDVPGRPAMFGTTRQFLDYFGLKKLDDLPPLADLADWESLRVQLNLPAVEETDEEQPLESAEVAELPVLQPALVEVESDDDEPAPDEELLRKAEALADTGFEEIVASEWPDPAATELNVVDAGDAAEEPAGEESRSADASVHSA